MSSHYWNRISAKIDFSIHIFNLHFKLEISINYRLDKKYFFCNFPFHFSIFSKIYCFSCVFFSNFQHRHKHFLLTTPPTHHVLIGTNTTQIALSSVEIRFKGLYLLTILAWHGWLYFWYVIFVYIFRSNVRTDKSWPVHVSTHYITLSLLSKKVKLIFFLSNLKGNLVRGLDRYNVLRSGKWYSYIPLTNLLECSHSGCT